MENRILGKNGPAVSALGLGCMGMSEFYGAGDDNTSIAVIHRALDLSCTFLDTADMYGVGRNEQLVGRAIRDRRDRVFLATKFGNVRGDDGKFLGVNGKPQYVKAACDASLKRLGVNVIDLYYQHRVDRDTPIEETVAAMADLVKAGKVRFLGLSEASAPTVRSAAKVHPIAALQSEFSLWSREVQDDGILQTCRELGIGFVAYSPLGRGFLTGQFNRPEDLPPDDARRNFPRFQGENFTRNLELVHHIQSLAARKNCIPSQLALAWVLAQGNDIVPIPGTKKLSHLEENLGALNIKIKLTPEELAEIDAVFPQPSGERYHPLGMKTLGG